MENNIIIIEGPDNSGKSTLVNRLVEDLSIPNQHSEGPWETRRELIESLEEIDIKNSSDDFFLQDRYGLISELIYQPILRPDHKIIDITDQPEGGYYNRLFKMEFLVICMPPKERLLEEASLVSQPKDIIAYMDSIINSYRNFIFMLKSHDLRLFVYDWTIPWHYRMLKLAIQGYYDNDVAARNLEPEPEFHL